MPTQVMQPTQVQIRESHHFTLIERYALRRFHPRRIAADMVSSMWAVYFLWNHDWRAALIVAVVISTVAQVTVRRTDPEAMSETLLGKLALLHLHPFNMALQLVGVVALIYGLWLHSTEYILGALSLVAAGHTVGWTQVDARLAQKQG